MEKVTAPRPRSVSVVIPTFNRLETLQSVLAALGAQELPWPLEVEVVVVDDGSTDGTWEWLRSLRREGLKRLRQRNSGPAAARNRGVEAASGEVVAFLGDDTVPGPGWLAVHLETHRVLGAEGQLAVLGYTTFPPELDDPFTRWINEYGAQFGYLLIEDAGQVPFNFFYTSNVSLPRELFLELGGFREDFPAAAWEDIEFAYRAFGEGVRMVYRPLALTVHNHAVDVASFQRRQRVAGRSAAIFADLHPELGPFLGLDGEGEPPPPGGRATLAGLLVALSTRLPGMTPGRWIQEAVGGPYRLGLREGRSREAGRSASKCQKEKGFEENLEEDPPGGGQDRQ